MMQLVASPPPPLVMTTSSIDTCIEPLLRLKQEATNATHVGPQLSLVTVNVAVSRRLLTTEPELRANPSMELVLFRYPRSRKYGWSDSIASDDDPCTLVVHTMV